MICDTIMMLDIIKREYTISKHLKGQLDPPVGNSHVFAPKDVSWISLLVENTTKNCILARRSSLGLAGRRLALA